MLQTDFWKQDQGKDECVYLQYHVGYSTPNSPAWPHTLRGLWYPNQRSCFCAHQQSEFGPDASLNPFLSYKSDCNIYLFGVLGELNEVKYEEVLCKLKSSLEST